jgi:hypothetical protein
MMTTGINDSSTLNTDLGRKFIAPAKMTLEHKGIMEQLISVETLPDGEGLTYNQPKFGALSAQTVHEGIELDNPQTLSTTNTEITPGMTGIQVMITDKAKRTLKENVVAKAGQLMGTAMARKLDQDLLGLCDGFSTSLVGTGSALKAGHIAASFAKITGNTTEPGEPPINGVFHPFTYKALADTLVPLSSSAFSVPMPPDGISEYVLKNFYQKRLYNVDLFIDGNITIDSAADMKGAIFARDALIMVKTSLRMKHESQRNPGAQADDYYIFNEYGYAEYADHWGVEIYADATSPTS